MNKDYICPNFELVEVECTDCILASQPLDLYDHDWGCEDVL